MDHRIIIAPKIPVHRRLITGANLLLLNDARLHRGFLLFDQS